MRTHVVVVVGAVCLVVGAAVGQEAARPIEGSEFRLLGSKGELRAALRMEKDEPALIFFGVDGKPTATFGPNARTATDKEDAPLGESPKRAPDGDDAAADRALADFKPTGTIAPGLRAQYNEIKDFHSVDTQSFRFAGPCKFTVSLFGGGRAVKRTDVLMLNFTRVGDEWDWLKSHSVVFLLGDKRLRPESSFNSDIFSGPPPNCYEHVAVRTDLKTLLAIANGTPLRGAIGSTEFQAFPGLPEAVRDLLNCVGAEVK